MTATLIEYYAQRAIEYELIYAKPERQHDLAILRQRLPDLFADRHILEVACGTGYWTRFAAERAASIVATDVNEEVLDIARAKAMDPKRVNFVRANAYELQGLSGPFTAGFAAFWWSHVLKADIAGFLAQFGRMLEPGAHVVFIDNRYVPGSSTPISRTDSQGNTYQHRTLKDGTQFEVLKNFLSETDLRTAVEPFGDAVRIELLDYYWILTYSAASARTSES